MIDDLDRPVHGAERIAEILNLRKRDGSLDVRKAFYILESGYVDASKIGRLWFSTPRRLLNPAPPVKKTPRR